MLLVESTNIWMSQRSCAPTASRPSEIQCKFTYPSHDDLGFDMKNLFKSPLAGSTTANASAGNPYVICDWTHLDIKHSLAKARQCLIVARRHVARVFSECVVSGNQLS